MSQKKPQSQSNSAKSSIFDLDDSVLQNLGTRTANYYGRVKPKENFDGFTRLSQYPNYNQLIQDSSANSSKQHPDQSRKKRESINSIRNRSSQLLKERNSIFSGTKENFHQQNFTARSTRKEIASYHTFRATINFHHQDQRKTFRTLLNETKNEKAEEEEDQFNCLRKLYAENEKSKKEEKESIEQGKRERIKEETDEKQDSLPLNQQSMGITKKVEKQLKKSKKNKKEKKDKRISKPKRKQQKSIKQKLSQEPTSKRVRSKPLQYWKNQKIIFTQNKTKVILSQERILTLLQARSLDYKFNLNYSHEDDAYHAMFNLESINCLQFDGYTHSSKPLKISSQCQGVEFFYKNSQETIKLEFREQLQVNGNVPFIIYKKGVSKSGQKVCLKLPLN